MRFEHEKFDIEFIARRVREEQERNDGRRVTRVLLNGREWARFMLDSGVYERLGPCPFYKFAMKPECYSFRLDPGMTIPGRPEHVQIIEVVRE